MTAAHGLAELPNIAFVDVEASGLGVGSFPIEVGWAFLHGGGGVMLIRPAAEWDVDVWDEMAEAVHGISLPDLRSNGRSAREVAESLNLVLAGVGGLVCSDAVEMDAYWLARLFEQTPQPCGFRLEHETALRRRFLGNSGDVDLLGGSPRLHRAAADAEQLASAWRAQLSAC